MTITGKILRSVAACFLVASFVYLFYIVQVELLSDAFVSGFRMGEAQCAKPTLHFPPVDQYDGV